MVWEKTFKRAADRHATQLLSFYEDRKKGAAQPDTDSLVNYIVERNPSPEVAVLALMNTTAGWNSLELETKKKVREVYHFKCDEGQKWGEIQQEKKYVSLPIALYCL